MYQVQQLQVSLLGILGAGIGVFAFGVVVRRWLPSTPVLRHVLLVPPEHVTQDAAGSLDGLIGKTGVTVTRLAPAGKADIENQLYEVSADGMLIESGTAVSVATVRSGRLVVGPYDQEKI